MYTKSSQNKIYAYLVFLIWPFFSFFMAFYDYRKSWSKNLVWLFVAFYAYSMVISDEGMDASRYRDQFIEISASAGTTNSIVADIYADDSQTVDYLKPLLDQIVSSFTTNYKILFLIYGLIFGFFFSRNLWLLLDRAEHKITKISILLLIVFVIINPIWNINGFRFWTAAQIFVYGNLLYFLEGNRKGILITLTAFLVHFSFLLPSAILLLYMIMGNRLTLYFYFFLASLFITELNLEAVRNNLFFLPTVYMNRAENYVSEEYKEKLTENLKNANWYAQVRVSALKYSIYVFLIYLFWKGRIIMIREKRLYNLFSYVLLFYAIANVISYIPSVGRFISVVSGLSVSLAFLYMQYFNDNKFRWIIKASIPALLLFLIVTIRIGFDTIGLTTVFGNPIFAIIIEDDMALIELIK